MLIVQIIIMCGVSGGSVASSSSSIGVGMSVAGVLVRIVFFSPDVSLQIFFCNNNIIALFLSFLIIIAGFFNSFFTQKLSSSLYVMSNIFTFDKVLC